MAAVVLLLFCALLYAAGAQDPPVSNRTGVDLALEYLNSEITVPRIFRYNRTVDKQEKQSGGIKSKYVYEHLLLKPTVCLKGTVDSLQNCTFINSKPLMDCVVCYRTAFNQIQQSPQPYVHCIQKPRVTPEIKTNRIDACKKMAYLIGSTCLACAKRSF